MVFRSYKRRRFNSGGYGRRFKRRYSSGGRFSKFKRYGRYGRKSRYQTQSILARKGRDGIREARILHLQSKPSQGPWWMGDGVRAGIAAGILGARAAYGVYKKGMGYLGKAKKIGKFAQRTGRYLYNRWNWNRGSNYYDQDHFRGMPRKWYDGYHRDIEGEGMNDPILFDPKYYRYQKQLGWSDRQHVPWNRMSEAEWAPKKMRGDSWPELGAYDYGKSYEFKNSGWRDLVQARWDKVLAGALPIENIPPSTLISMRQYRHDMMKQGIDVAMPDLQKLPLNLNADPGTGRLRDEL